MRLLRLTRAGFVCPVRRIYWGPLYPAFDFFHSYFSRSRLAEPTAALTRTTHPSVLVADTRATHARSHFSSFYFFFSHPHTLAWIYAWHVSRRNEYTNTLPGDCGILCPVVYVAPVYTFHSPLAGGAPSHRDGEMCDDKVADEHPGEMRCGLETCLLSDRAVEPFVFPTSV